MESHNHPSYIEPYQGAATGMGGILRDVFTMGARPIAAMNALRFGAPSHEKTRHLVSGVVAGVGGYANSFGVPTVGGEVEFDERYNGNILVNAFAAGLADIDKIFYSKAEGVGLPVVYLGAKTGRDGVGGATMASAEFGNDIEQKRPTVQVGDPFTEKRLLEACLELMATGAVVAIQDMGAAGLTCSAVEMGAKGDLGIALDLDKVPVREVDMTPYEMMLSESQERMLMVLRPAKEAAARAVFQKWELDFATVGITTSDLRFRVKWQGKVVADLPIKDLGDQAPEYDRPWTKPVAPAPLELTDVPQMDVAEALLKLLGSHAGSSRRWVYEQYDTWIQGNSLQRPGGDAGVIRVDGPNPDKALAFSSDVTPRYCEADPYEGGKQAVAECWRNLTAVGAEPIAATDNLNFGNPERPEIMGQLAEAVRGISDACRALDFPIVSGNVSLYNETNGQGILPTPTIGGVGLLGNWKRSASIGFAGEGEPILLVGAPDWWGSHLGQSLYSARTVRPQRRPAAAGRPRRRKKGRRSRPHPDPRRQGDRGARPLGRWSRGWAGGNGDGFGHRRQDQPARGRRRDPAVLRRGPGALPHHRPPRFPRELLRPDLSLYRSLRAVDRHHRRHPAEAGQCARHSGERIALGARGLVPGVYGGRNCSVGLEAA